MFRFADAVFTVFFQKLYSKSNWQKKNFSETKTRFYYFLLSDKSCFKSSKSDARKKILQKQQKIFIKKTINRRINFIFARRVRLRKFRPVPSLLQPIAESACLAIRLLLSVFY